MPTCTRMPTRTEVSARTGQWSGRATPSVADGSCRWRAPGAVHGQMRKTGLRLSRRCAVGTARRLVARGWEAKLADALGRGYERLRVAASAPQLSRSDTTNGRCARASLDRGAG